MAVQLVLLIILLLWRFVALHAAPQSMAKPNCQPHCGNVNIPYPFGMEAGCYLDERFRIHCNSNKTPSLSINGINLEVLKISVDEGTIHVKFPILYSSNCRGKESNPIIVNLEGSPFVYSEKWNRFVVVGCNNIVLMTQNDSIYGGCMSICDESSNSATNHASCNGINCCQMKIPSHLMSFNAVFKDLDDGEDRGRDQCKHAYLVEQRWFQDRLNSSLEIPYSVTDMDYVPVVLDWMIDYWIFESLERNGSSANNETYHCHVNNYDNILSNQKSMVKCSCSAGYHGNPYLPAGCPDINECEDPLFNDCWKENMICVNFDAGYGCMTPEVKKSPVKMVVKVICAALGVFFLLCGTWWTYKVVKKNKGIDKLKKKFFKQDYDSLLQEGLSLTEVDAEEMLSDVEEVDPTI